MLSQQERLSLLLPWRGSWSIIRAVHLSSALPVSVLLRRRRQKVWAINRLNREGRMAAFVRFVFTIMVVGMAVNLAVVLAANSRSQHTAPSSMR